jgi:glucose-6-phosphate-specific signal transduction histidine kinase
VAVAVVLVELMEKQAHLVEMVVLVLLSFATLRLQRRLYPQLAHQRLQLQAAIVFISGLHQVQ